MVQIAQALQELVPNSEVVWERDLHHNSGEPKGRSPSFHHHVGWNFSRDVEWEEDSQSNVVFQ